MTMMMASSPDHNPCRELLSEETITTATCASWKLYDNPFYYPDHHQKQCQCSSNKQHIHHQHFPLLSGKVGASYWDLTFIKRIMESEFNIAQGQIIELKANLEYERKARRKLESINKRLAKEVGEERKGREAIERVCEELAREVSSDKIEIDRMKNEIEEERKMLRIAEVLREERVQMKLVEAKIFFEEKLLEFEETKRTQSGSSSNSKMEKKNKESVDKLERVSQSFASNLSGKFARLVLKEQNCDDSNKNCYVVDSSKEPSRVILAENRDNFHMPSMAIQRRASSEPENPHIKRGIKGFIEFPRVVKAIGSKSRHWGTKLECQKAQLRILLKHKSPLRSNSLIIS